MSQQPSQASGHLELSPPSIADGEPEERVALALVDGYLHAGGAFQQPSPTVLAGLDRWIALLG